MDQPAELDLKALASGEIVRDAEDHPAMIWLCDTAGQAIYLNKASRKFYGLRPGEIAQFRWASMLLSDDAAGTWNAFQNAMRDRQPFRIAARIRRADGAIRAMEARAEPRFAPNGEFLGMIGVNVDHTEDA